MSDVPTRDAGNETPLELHRPANARFGRRAMLQSLMATFGAGAALPFISEGHPMHEHLADQRRVATADARAGRAGYKPEFLDAHQLQTLDILAERIIPGSRRAGVAPFLDSLLAVGAAASQGRLVSSLGAFDMLAIERRHKPWKALTAAEQDELLADASTAASGSVDAPAAAAPLAAPPAHRLTIRDYFDDLRGWISGAYYSSEIGMRELGWTGQTVFDALPGCEHPDKHR